MRNGWVITGGTGPTGERTQMLRGLRIAADSSANIGSSLTTPTHHWPDRPKRTLTSLLCPLGARGTCDASLPPHGLTCGGRASYGQSCQPCNAFFAMLTHNRRQGSRITDGHKAYAGGIGGSTQQHDLDRNPLRRIRARCPEPGAVRGRDRNENSVTPPPLRGTPTRSLRRQVR